MASPWAGAGGLQAGAGRIGARTGRSGGWRLLPGARRSHARTRHGAMLPRWPAEPGRISLPRATTAGPAIPGRRGPARGRPGAGRHGISWWLRRLSRYHGSLRAGWDGS